MKSMRALTLIYIIELMVIFSVTLAQNWNQLTYNNNQQKRTQPNCRFPLFNCRLINKFLPTKRQTGLRGISQTKPTINSLENGMYDQSSLYPSYALPVYAGSSYIPTYQQYQQNPQLQGLGSEYQFAQTLPQTHNDQQTAYGPQAGYTAQNYGQSPNTIDVHQVLDQFIRSAGLSPQGDHEAEAAHSNSFAKAGTSPVLTFKKLFSFPFYLSTDPNVVDLYGKNWK